MARLLPGWMKLRMEILLLVRGGVVEIAAEIGYM
jgi:hypothetical protein